ncbi:fimbrillin family protein [Phocaeicola plebeius]|uniref:fimbrillin family protein n=1 Tax=Phocaeicola plebeius TaxID=310297 RepID=UPI00307EA0A0
MKRYTIYTFSALALLLAAAACTQDEAGFLPEGAEGTPIVFTVTGLNPTATATAGTRAPVDGNWEGVQSVAVRMDGTVKAYNVTPSISDNTSATLTSDEPYYWTNHNNITVTAWWPYTAGETTPPAVKVAADQSARKDFEGSDLIVAEEQTVSYGNPTLRFTHRTAQITVVLTNYTEGMASVRLTGLSTENGNPAEIAPYDKGGDTYTALVAPQSVVAGTAFITCAFNNGKTFAYRMQGAAEWKAGEEYTYTVSLAAAEDPGYTVSEDGNTYEVYNADGLLAWNKAVQGNLLLNCTLTDDINLTGKEWTPIGDYDNRYTGTFDGGNHTITGLTINQYGNYVGMIDFLDSGGTVQNLTLENVNITGGDIVGSVVGDNYGTVTACTASGNVSGTSRIGGVVGYNNGTVTACYHASGNVSGTSYIGGVVGRNTSGTLTACYHASGNVSGTSNVGGVVGYNISGTLTACYWSGLPDNDNGGATKVDGTTVTWQNAVDAMNTALQSAGSEWRYELTGELPTLKKQ